MTETFAPSAPAGDDNVMHAPEEVSSTGSGLDRRRVAIVGGLLAAVLAGGGYFLLGHHGSSQSATFTPNVAKPSAAAPGGGAAGTPQPSASPLTKYTGAPAGRDPFKPLVTAPPPPAPPSPTASQATPSPTVPPVVGGVPGGTTFPGGGFPSTAPSTAPSTPGSSGSSGVPSPAPSSSTPTPATVLVLHGIVGADTATPKVSISFDGKAYTLKAGEQVNGTLELVSIQPDDGLAVFQLGDQTFDLHVGQTYLG